MSRLLALSLVLAGCGRIAPGTAEISHEAGYCETHSCSTGAAAAPTAAPTSAPAPAPVCQTEQYKDGNMIYTRCK